MNIAIPKCSADVTLERVGAEAILYDRRNGRAHVINNSAARIWDLCDGHTNVEQITGAFAAVYDLPSSEVHDDVLAILATFHELRVLD